MTKHFEIIKTDEGYEVRQTNSYLNGATHSQIVARYAGFDDAVADVHHRQLNLPKAVR